jgi:hypothetical protein
MYSTQLYKWTENNETNRVASASYICGVKPELARCKRLKHAENLWRHSNLFQLVTPDGWDIQNGSPVGLVEHATGADSFYFLYLLLLSV